MSVNNPQLEDGHLKIANSVAEALARTQLSGYESRVLWFLWRKTYGWSKKTDLISLSQWVDGTKLDRKSIMRTLKKLRDRRMIVRYGDGIVTQDTHTYEFNKHYGEWKEVTKSSLVAKSSLEVVTKSPHTTTTSTTTSKRIFKDIVPTEEIGTSLETPLKEKIEKPKKVPVDWTKDEFMPASYEVLEYLNDKAHRKFEKIPATVKLIHARLKEGRTLEQLKLIIDEKVDEWGTSPKWKKGLNNETLFRQDHFPRYLEEATTWNERRMNSASGMMLDDKKTGVVLSKEERKKAMDNLFEGFGDGPDGKDPIVLQEGRA